MDNCVHPFQMSEQEYENVFRNRHLISKDLRKDIKSYQLKPDKQVRYQIALLHSIQGGYEVDIDFDRKEREIK